MIDINKVIPVNDKILIEVDTKETDEKVTEINGILVASTYVATNKNVKAKVLKISSKSRYKNQLDISDTILVSNYVLRDNATKVLEKDNLSYYLIRDVDIIGIIN